MSKIYKNLARGTSDLYSLSRTANKARIVDALLQGNIKPAIHYIKNRVIFHFIGPLLRK